MRVSVDIDEEILREVMALTGETQKSPALAKAILEFTYRRRAKEFGRLIRESAFDYPDPSAGGEDPADPVPPLPAV
ncbi:MAG: type II toxin-antitoxin system VapB family antitoxin [Verrucomicrobia bacterium]|nr:type II toxin-antitoxin system VapB family antitoxin [Verrucomicrobiota bacterium]